MGDEEETPLDPHPNAETPPDDDVVEIELSRQIKAIRLKGENGAIQNYTVRELMGGKKDDWLDFCQKRLKTEGGKVVGMKSYKGMEAKLISMCLYDEHGVPVPEVLIEPWPATAKAKLFKLCQKLSALDEDGEGEKNAKNS